jgi:macrolide transport system ATP-binding/permease protein
MQTLWQDLRFSARMLMKKPGFTLIAIITLAFGIGANTAIFSIVNSALLKPLPVTQPDQLVSLYTSDFSGPLYGKSSYQDYLDFRERAEVLDGLIAYWGQSVRLGPAGQAEESLSAEIVSGNYFSVLGVKPAFGRAFLPEEDLTPGAHPVVVVSYGCWLRRFGGDPNLVGKQIILNKLSYTVVGVAPPRFTGLARGVNCDVWLPMAMTPQVIPGDDSLENRSARGMSLMGRLKPGVSLAHARARFSLLAKQQRTAYPQIWSDAKGASRVITVAPESQSRIPPEARNMALGVTGLALAVVGMVLVIACANLAGMLLARATTRRKEIALRMALGATRLRLIRLLLAESLLLSALGATLGLFMSWWAIDLVAGFLPPTGLDFSPDALVLGFTCAVSLLTALIFGLAPALQSTKPDLVAALKDESSVSGYRRSRLRSGLVIAQVAISVLLLIGSGLFLRSLRNFSAVDPGFNQKNLLLVELELGDYKEADGRELYRRMLERLRGLPGVRAVSTVNRPGLDFDGTRRSVDIEGYHPQRGEITEIAFNLVGPHYFRTMETPLLRGRDFTERDVAGAHGVVIINETLARRFFPGQDALGKRLSIHGPDGPFLEIIGIARDGKYWSLGEETQPFFSLPLLQNYQGYSRLVLRAENDPRLLIESVRQEILAIDRNLRISDPITMSEHIGFALMPLRIGSIASAIFGLLAMLLACLGLYGVVAYFVGLQTREFGVRIALGACGSDILKLVFRQGMGLVVIGVALGLVGSFAAARLLSSFLFGVGAMDLMTLISVAVLLGIASLLACYIPARRAMKVDPVIALRCE